MKKFIILIFAAALATGVANAQTYAYCGGDTVTLGLPVFRGNLQWQQSADSINWADISGATFQPYKMVFDIGMINKYYRAKITENTCNPVYSQVIKTTLSFSCAFVCGVSIITDIDGNYYSSVQIGNQCWLKENLNTSHYSDGSVIPNVTDNTAWAALTTGARSYYNNDSVVNADVYGALYNWYAVNDSRNIAPAGWHVATDSEWNIMEKFLDNTVDTTVSGSWTGTDIGSRLKATSGWNSGGNGTNSSGFSAFPGGSRNYGGTFYGIGNYGYWWSATDFDSTYAWLRNLNYNSSQVYRNYYDKRGGFSVRCVRD